MWGDPDPDPGGPRPDANTLSPQELSELKEQNEQQLVLIAQLKEMLRKEQSTVSQEKVEEYVNTLNRNKAKRSRQKKDGVTTSNTGAGTSVGIDASKKERINLLRQQMEENKARLAERGKSQKGIEEMVTQLQAQLKDNQTLISSTPLNVSLVETKSLDYSENTPQKDLYNILLTKEKKITELLNKSQKLEGTVLDLQENLKEKDSVIDARTKAITLMTESLNKKGKTTLDALEETKEQMRKMQENFVTLEAEMKARQLTLLNDLKMKNFEISDLQEANSRLEREKLDLENILSETKRLEDPIARPDNDEFEQLRREFAKLQEENQNNLQKINKLEETSLGNATDPDIQNKLKESYQQNADNLSMISELELQLEEALSKLTVEQENVDSLEIIKNNLEEEKNKLLEVNRKLSEDNSQNLTKISELQKQLEDSLTDLKLLKSTGMGSSIQTSQENEEIVKLKKQMDESNKNMIKMRAVQKGKIKELNKKLDQFKKMGDANVLIGQLQNEISKLNEKIAEIEDEKGNLQLKMVESTSSSKGDLTEFEEQIKELEDKLTKVTEELGERNKVIEILESEVLSLKTNLKIKTEEEVKVSTQVSSEMSSINYEEQIEKIESEKKKCVEELNVVILEKEELLKEMEHLKKEKQDISAKLDNYMQENMDLIDKLEKLSAEKVSSAESIEIVEGLTQQEKLELAAYQKHINPEEPLKDEDNLDPPVELNESVLQLGEDTVELLQRIEMFTQERKEVMQKMEALKEENTSLSLKVKEIENNRDILDETYEQLQNDKEALANEKLDLLEKLENAKEIGTMEKEEGPSAEVLDSKLKELQMKCEALVEENNELKRTLKEFDSKIQEKYDLEFRLREMMENNSTLENKLLSNLNDINAYELTINENKDELIRSLSLINELQIKLEERDRDIGDLHTNINDLNKVITELQTKQDSYEVMESELSNLKSVLTDQITQANDYESEMAQSNETIHTLQNEIVQMNRRILELENELDLKDGEIHKINKELNNKDQIIKNLQIEIEEKDRKFRTVSEEIKEKYIKLQSQLDSNGESLKKQIGDLTGKNKEQLEKMKKIAANLKKKSQAYEQLENQYKSDKEKWESEANEKNNVIHETEEIVAALTKKLKDIESRLNIKLDENEAIQNEIFTLNEKINLLEQNNANQQHFIQELKHRQEKLQEVSLQQEMSASLHEEIDNSFPKNVPEEKIRELELLLETNDFELNHYKERIDKLEESIRTLEEEKIALESKNTVLLEKLDLTSTCFKEKALLEDQLELRLAEVSANDEALSKKLLESQKEKEEIHKKNQEYEELIKKIKIKLKKAHDKVTELKAVQTNLQDLETLNQELKNQIITLEANQRHIQNENESLQRRNMSDYEKIEADYQIQLEELLKTKNDLTVENEKLLDNLKDLREKEHELILELDEYKLRLDQSENSHITEINRLNADIIDIKGELERTVKAMHSESQRLSVELNESHENLQQSLVEVNRLNHELNITKDKLINFEELQEQLTNSFSKNQELNDKLKFADNKLEHILVESDGFNQQLEISNKSLEASLQDNKILRGEIEKLNQEIQALEFAKSSLEASYESISKPSVSEAVNPTQSVVVSEEFSLHSKQTPEAIPNFYWDSQQTTVDLFDSFSGTQTLPKSTVVQNEQPIALFKKDEQIPEKSLFEVDELKQLLNTSNEKLQFALQEAAHLRNVTNKLEQENQALQFAKTSLEASFESSQKLGDEKFLDPSQAIVLEPFSQENIKLNQEVSVPVFDAFSQTNKDFTFDVFGTQPSEGQWFNQQKVQPLSLPQLDEIRNPNNMNTSDSQPQPFSPVIEDGREALLKKIKALEFLLYNVDKEKEIALEQCTEMVNELTQVIYDQANAPRQHKGPISDLESQIMSRNDIDDLASNKPALQQAEYTATKKEYGETSLPVSEEMIVPQKAYLCFDEDISKEPNRGTADIDSQVVSERDIKRTSDKKVLQSIEYESVDKSLGEQQQPVVEPLAQPKQAYLLYTKDDKPQSFEAFEENDDGWGWGPEEARLEEEHMSNVDNTPQVKSLLLEIQQLKENIRVLQVERENHLEEIKQLQIKSGKLIKRYKEIKAKSDQASSSKKQDDGGFFDLNETIQEELKAQVEQLEKRIKEIASDLEKEKLEKSGLLKRVDVLTAANERMTEMKEIQDSEVLRWQRKHQESVKKLQEYEWGSDGFGEQKQKIIDGSQPSVSGTSDQNMRISELENTIKDLTLDNEELQTLLEEQTTRRVEAEKNKSSGNEEEISELRYLNESLHKECNQLKLSSTEIQSELTSTKNERDRLIQEKSDLEKMLQDKESEVRLLEEKLGNMETKKAVEQQEAYNQNQSEVAALMNQISNQEIHIHEKDLIIEDLQNNLDELNNRKVELDNKVTQLTNDLTTKYEMLESNQNDETKLEIFTLKAQLEQLIIAIDEKEKIVDNLNLLVKNLEHENHSRGEVINQLQGKITENNDTIKSVTAEKEHRDLEYQQVLNELSNNAVKIEEYQRTVLSLEQHINEIEHHGAEEGKNALENQNLHEKLKIKSLEIEEKERRLEEVEMKLHENNQLLANMQKLSEDLESKIKEVEELTSEKVAKDKEIQQLMIDLQNKDEDFEARTNTLVNELHENWQIQVDQRGADIAESWKMHLEMVEKDYSTLQEKLKSDAVELEEKCNILVNENNELRKNVDQDIRNEVDKLSALQQQVSNQQQIINSLNMALQEKDKKIEEIENNLSNYLSLENEIQTLRNDNVEKENKLASINIIIETTQKQFDEKREVVEEIISVLETNALSPISYEKEDILREFQKQLGSVGEKNNEISRLNELVSEIETKLNRISGENNREITGLNQVIEDLERELSVIHEKEAEIVRLNTELLTVQVEKDSLQREIEKIKEEKDNLTPEHEKLKQEHLNCQSTIQECQQRIQDYYNANMTLQQALDERNIEISELNQKILQLQEGARNDSNKEVECLNTTISKAKEEYITLQETLTACQKELYEATQELADKSQKLETTNQNLYYYQQNYTAFEEEIHRLKGILDQREREYTNSLEMLKNNQMVDIQRHYNDLLSNKEQDNLTLQAQVQELIQNNQGYSERINQEVAIKQQLEEQLGEQTQLVDDDTKQLEELKLIIEDQVIKIEELKKELFDKSNQYDSLIAEMDVGRPPVTQQPIASISVNSLEAAQKLKYVEDDLTEPASRAELDLALYMLHQRDVRCEELTVELTHLLEERDALQLRLSNAIREKEDLKRTIDYSPVPTTVGDKETTSLRSKSSAIFLAASGTELAKDPLQSEHSLETKLSELKVVGYKKDKTFVDEQDARRLQQLAIMQQHINEASKLPPEAAARLVDASYTLSRDVQSPSKVLLNWLWGKNPPKANDS